MPHPLKIHGRRTELQGIHLKGRLERGAATIEVVGKVPDNRPYVCISNDRNETIATIDPMQMNGLVRRWLKANGWIFTRTEAESAYKKPRQRRKNA